tara:strand:- start:137 stop:1228 length:1092 start_codon:yes stop_codon:yes gene_type:complete
MAGLLNVIKGVGKGVGEVYDAGKGLLDQFDMDKIKGWHGTPHEFPSAVRVKDSKTGKFYLIPEDKLANHPVIKRDPSRYEEISRHDLGAFDNSKMGTGEGAQAYGWGTYIAEQPKTGQYYRDALLPRHNLDEDLMIGDTPILDVYNHLENTQQYEKAALIEDLMLEGDLRYMTEEIDLADTIHQPEDLEWFFNEIAPNFKRTGKLYGVDIKTDPSKMLDLDKSYTSQSDHVKESLQPFMEDINLALTKKNAIRSRYNGNGGVDYQLRDFKGSDIYDALSTKFNSRESASKALSESGITGNRFLDESSRAAGSKNKTSNFVVFDDKLLDITKKYAAALPITGGLFAAGDSIMEDKKVGLMDGPI